MYTRARTCVREHTRAIGLHLLFYIVFAYSWYDCVCMCGVYEYVTVYVRVCVVYSVRIVCECG